MVYQGEGWALYCIALKAQKGGLPEKGILVRNLETNLRAASAVAGLHLDGMMEGHSVVDLVELAFASKAGEEAADGFAGEAGHATKLFVRELHEEGERKIGVEGAVAGFVRASEVEEGAGKFASGGGMESEAASGKDGAVVLASEGLGNELTDNGGVGHEANKVRAGDGFDDTGFE
jgi:hypothetical protein